MAVPPLAFSNSFAEEYVHYLRWVFERYITKSFTFPHNAGGEVLSPVMEEQWGEWHVCPNLVLSCQQDYGIHVAPLSELGRRNFEWDLHYRVCILEPMTDIGGLHRKIEAIAEPLRREKGLGRHLVLSITGIVSETEVEGVFGLR